MLWFQYPLTFLQNKCQFSLTQSKIPWLLLDPAWRIFFHDHFLTSVWQLWSWVLTFADRCNFKTWHRYQFVKQSRIQENWALVCWLISYFKDHDAKKLSLNANIACLKAKQHNKIQMRKEIDSLLLQASLITVSQYSRSWAGREHFSSCQNAKNFTYRFRRWRLEMHEASVNKTIQNRSSHETKNRKEKKRFHDQG